MDVRLTLFRDLLAPLRPGRLLDLGTGHGSFAEVAQQLGWEVTAVDARADRMPMTAGIEWVQEDVRTFEIDGFDCIALLGLLYHLELADQRDLLARCAPTATILDTHVALEPRIRRDGRPGRLFTEDTTVPTASWGNERSFWPTEPALVRLLYEAGYGAVYKHTPPYRSDRTFWLCLPPHEQREPLPWRAWLDRERPSPAARLLAGLRAGLGGIRRRLVDARR